MQEPVITPVSKENQIETIENLAAMIWNQHFTAIIGQDQVDYMLQKFQSTAAIRAQIESGYEYYMASVGNQARGYMSLLPDRFAAKMMLSKIYVCQQLRGTGIGSRLLDFARERCIDAGIRLIWLSVNRHNTSTIRWYEKKGFCVTRELKTDIGNGYFMDDFVMECGLD